MYIPSGKTEQKHPDQRLPMQSQEEKRRIHCSTTYTNHYMQLGQKMLYMPHTRRQWFQMLNYCRSSISAVQSNELIKNSDAKKKKRSVKNQAQGKDFTIVDILR